MRREGNGATQEAHTRLAARNDRGRWMPAASLSPARSLSASSGSRFSTNLPTPRVGTNTGEGSAFVGRWHRVSVGSVELVALQDTQALS